MKISIKLCGGCNPKINRSQIAEKLKAHLEATGFTVFYNRFDVDFVIFISGCTVNCAERHNPNKQTIYTVVAGETIDSANAAQETLVNNILQRVRGYSEKLEKCLLT